MGVGILTQNGMVAKNRNGRSVNGRVGAVNGLTNGSGMTNGNNKHVNGRNRGTNGTNMKAGLAILVFLLLLIPPIMILMGPAETRKIDGNIDDWGAITPVEQVPTGMSVPITKYAMDMDDKYVYFYVQVQSPHGVFESKGNYRDNVVLFLDMGVAGYVIDGIQAKYKIEVSGSDGNVVSSSLSEYAGTGFDWNWTPKGSIEAKANIDTLEGRIKKADIGNTEPVMYILIQRADGSMGRSMIPMDKRMHGVSVTQTGIASEIIEPGTDAQLLTFNVRAYGKDTVLTSINIKRTGAYDGALSVKVVDESGAEVGSTEIAAGSNSASVSMGRTITKNADAMYRVVANVSGVANNSVGVEIVSAVADGTVKIDGSSRTVYVGEPHGIIIDGAFGDWTNIPASWDPNDDVATPANLPVNPNLDINCTKRTNDTAAAYFYAKVSGDTILAGLTQMYRGVAVTGNGTGPAIETMDAYDYAYINFTVSETGKEYSILIKGKNGEVLSKKVQSRDLGSAQWSEDTTLSNALTVACSGGELELGIPFTDGNITTYTVTMTDWQGKDATSVIVAQHEHVRTTYHTIWVDGYLGDWQSDENMGGRDYVTWYLTWDNTTLYVGVDRGENFHYNSTDYDVMWIYLDTIPGGGNQSVNWNGRHTLPFDADMCFLYCPYYNYWNLRRWDAGLGDWNASQYYTGNVAINDTLHCAEMSIPLANIGYPSALNITFYFTNGYNNWLFGASPKENPTGASPQTLTGYWIETSLTNGNAPNTAKKHIPPLTIASNNDLISYAADWGWAGDGTESNPYIIEGYDIDANGGTYCIWIENTNVWFVVENCKLWNATNPDSEPYGSGIYLHNVQHGTLANNHCSNNTEGISLSSSSGNAITNNTCSGNSEGIYLSSSSSNTITNNTCSGNSDGGIYLSSSSSNTITNNTCSGNSEGIYLSSSSDDNTITNNTCSGNSDCGIYLYSSSNNHITNNTCSGNSYGVYLFESCSYNTITNNNFCQNTNYGVYIASGSTGNTIHHNNFWYNNGAGKGLNGNSQARDDDGGNIWYDDTTNEGNYWSNWDNKGVYQIDGAGASDPSPLNNPVPELSPFAVMVVAIALLGVVLRRRR